MFNTTLYALAFGLYLENWKSAVAHCDWPARNHFACIMAKILNRAFKAGYQLDWKNEWRFVKA